MKTTTNKSLRPDRPNKALRRVPVMDGETDEANRAPGAGGEPGRKRSRPGRAASLRRSSQVTRSQRWRKEHKPGETKRRGVLAKGSRTGRGRK
jgi:hypothetical protein